MKIALVHDQLHEIGGAERVLFSFKKMFPKAPIYTAFATRDKLTKLEPESKTWEIHESFIAKIPLIRRLYSPLRFLAPKIWESFDFSGYDVVLSSSGWYMCKGLKFPDSAIHISYIHHPPRYLYGYETAMEWQKYLPIRIYANIINHFLRIWDYESTQRPNILIANSVETQKRIKKFYRRDSTVIYPPVIIPSGHNTRNLQHVTPDYYVTVSRLQKAKHLEVLINAANKLKFRLKIVGEGRDREELEKIAGPTVEFMGRLPDADFPELYKGAKAFLFASKDEEFGIAPIEAMGYGVPVVAYKSGGLMETVKEGENGFLYDELTTHSLISSIQKLNKLTEYDYEVMCKKARLEAEKYSEERFAREINAIVKNNSKY